MQRRWVVEPLARVRLLREMTAVAALGALGACWLLACPVHGQEQKSIGLPAIWIMDRDGSSAELLAKLPDMKWHGSPSWSHGGKMVAFDATPANMGWSQCRVFVIGVEGPFKGMVKDLGCGNCPTWSPDDKQIAFHVLSGNPDGAEPGIWVMNADGTGRKQLCRSGGRPRWSPDGRKIVVWGLAILDVQGGKTTKILEDQHTYSDGATWSPDSKRLTLVGPNAKSREPELCVVDADGGKGSLRVLARGNLGHQIPSWSPDGKQIVFWIKDETGVRQLYSVSPDTPGPPVLIDKEKGGVWNADPAWSPDSKRIVFSSDRVEKRKGEAEPTTHSDAPGRT